MEVNKAHPDYQEYIQKCKELQTAEMAEEDKILSRYPDWNGQDHPESERLRQIYMKYSIKLKTLQAEYSYLFQ